MLPLQGRGTFFAKTQGGVRRGGLAPVSASATTTGRAGAPSIPSAPPCFPHQPDQKPPLHPQMPPPPNQSMSSWGPGIRASRFKINIGDHPPSGAHACLTGWLILICLFSAFSYQPFSKAKPSPPPENLPPQPRTRARVPPSRRPTHHPAREKSSRFGLHRRASSTYQS
jgi:hypothetical protein